MTTLQMVLIDFVMNLTNLKVKFMYFQAHNNTAGNVALLMLIVESKSTIVPTGSGVVQEIKT